VPHLHLLANVVTVHNVQVTKSVMKHQITSTNNYSKECRPVWFQQQQSRKTWESAQRG